MRGGGKLNFNPSSFLRIFIPQIVPGIDKALFIDSDTYVCNGIKELYDIGIDNYYCAMSYNMPIYRDMLQEAQMNLNDGYYNAGIILLNLKAWREDEIQKKILKFYYDNGGNFPTDDQSVINAIVASKTFTLPYKYNAMIGTFYWSYYKFCKINTEVGNKTKSEYLEAKHKPVIVHFNGPGVRPWEKFCAHPFTSKYRKLLLEVNLEYLLGQSGKGIGYDVCQYLKHKVIDRIECSFNDTWRK